MKKINLSQPFRRSSYSLLVVVLKTKARDDIGCPLTDCVDKNPRATAHLNSAIALGDAAQVGIINSPTNELAPT